MLQRYWFLLASFRNGAALVCKYRRRLPCDHAVCWDGATLHSPPNRTGLIETILEIWHEEVYTGKFYQPKCGDVVIDAGASVGLFCVWLARNHPDCRILAFEPFAENYQRLLQNIASSHVSTIEAHQAALAGKPGLGRMVDGGSRLLDHRLAVEIDDSTSEPAIPVCSFKQVIEMANAGRIGFFKIDIEGSEHSLFENVSTEDLKRVSRFAIEYHDNLCPGTLHLLKSRLHESHDVVIRNADEDGYGMLYAELREFV